MHHVPASVRVAKPWDNAERMRLPRWNSRRGITLEAIAWMLALVGGLAAAAVVITPRLLLANQGSAQHRRHLDRAAVPAHQEILDDLAALIGRSHRVLEVRHRGNGPFESIALWLTDHENPGELDPNELAVLSHSRTMQSLVCHYLEDDADQSPNTIPGPSALGRRSKVRSSLALQLSAAMISGESLSEFWRRQPAVKSRVIAREISDLVFEFLPTQSSGDPQRRHLRLTLTWPADSADGSDVASTFVDVLCSSNESESQQ